MKKIFFIFLFYIFLVGSISANVIKPENINESKKTDMNLIIQTINKSTFNYDDLPSQFSWKNYGGNWMTSVKNCYGCGSGWAITALDVFEAAINIAKGDPSFDRDLSEQYLLSCLSAAGSCSGGWMSKAIEYITSTNPGPTGNGINGCPLESCMPYQSDDTIPCSDKCENWDYYTQPPSEDNTLWQIQDYGTSSFSEDSQSDWNTMKSWLLLHGPIAADLYASSSYLNYWDTHHDSSDVYQIDDAGTSNIGVAICGWVDDPDIINGGYWILKHNWGTGWGYGGYANIAYGCNSLGTRDVTWVHAMEWINPDPIPDLNVLSNFDYSPKYPHPGEEIEFYDQSQGNIKIWEWDLDGDGIIDSNVVDPTFTYETEGEYQVTLTVKNEYGISNTLSKKIGVFHVWPPIAIIEPEQYPEPDHPENDLEIHFDARYSYDPDNGEIVDYHWDFDDGTTADEKYLYHVFPEYDRIYEVNLTLTDNDGGMSTKTCEVKIDKTVPPETSIHHGFGSINAEWYSETQRIYFTSMDWTRVINTYYRIDGGEWIRYIKEEQEFIPIGSEGMHEIQAYSIDYYGNQENPVSDIFGIDKTMPHLNISLSGKKINDEFIGQVNISLDADDELSGINKIRYKKLGDLSWVDYTEPVTLSESCFLDCIAIDKAGNINEELIQLSVEPAPLPPSISGPHRSCPDKMLNYTFKAIDNSPFAEDNIFFYIEWGDGEIEEWIGPYDSGEELILNHTFKEKGTYQIKAKARDVYGATSEWSEPLCIQIPKTKVKPFSLYWLHQQLIEIYPFLQVFLELWE